jgi:hypothetical protein
MAKQVTGKSAAQERYISVSLKLMNSPAYIALDRCAQALFFDLRTKFKGDWNNGDINAALTELKHRGWSSETTLAKALRQLQATGFIVATRRTVGVENGSKVCNLYRFTDHDVRAQPKVGIEAMRATHDYQKIETLADARRIVKAASAPVPMKEAAREKRKKTTMQKLHRDDAETAPMSTINDAETAPATTTPTTETAPITQATKRRKPAPVNGFKPVSDSASDAQKQVQKLHTYIDLPVPAPQEGADLPVAVGCSAVGIQGGSGGGSSGNATRSLPRRRRKLSETDQLDFGDLLDVPGENPLQTLCKPFQSLPC